MCAVCVCPVLERDVARDDGEPERERGREREGESEHEPAPAPFVRFLPAAAWSS